MGAKRSPRTVSAARIDDWGAGCAMARLPAGVSVRTPPVCGMSAAVPPMSDGLAERRAMSEGAAESRPLCEGGADIRPMSASSAREQPLSADVRHPARESVLGARERDTAFGHSSARTYERKCQNRPISHSAPPPPASDSGHMAPRSTGSKGSKAFGVTLLDLLNLRTPAPHFRRTQKKLCAIARLVPVASGEPLAPEYLWSSSPFCLLAPRPLRVRAYRRGGTSIYIR